MLGLGAPLVLLHALLEPGHTLLVVGGDILEVLLHQRRCQKVLRELG
jgi:hypothetical protein